MPHHLKDSSKTEKEKEILGCLIERQDRSLALAQQTHSENRYRHNTIQIQLKDLEISNKTIQSKLSMLDNLDELKFQTRLAEARKQWESEHESDISELKTRVFDLEAIAEAGERTIQKFKWKRYEIQKERDRLEEELEKSEQDRETLLSNSKQTESELTAVIKEQTKVISKLNK